MTCRALLHARQHATTCNGLECAPPEPVDATRLREARERMRLPIRVVCDDAGIIVAGELMPPPHSLYAIWYNGADPAEATRAYFALVASLTEPAQASRAATAGVGPASTSASLSPSAAPNPASVQSVAPGAETPSVLGASNPGAR